MAELERAADAARVLALEWLRLTTEHLRTWVWVRRMVRRVVVGAEDLIIELDASVLVHGLLNSNEVASDKSLREGTAPLILELRCAFARARYGGALHLVTPGTAPQPAAVSDALLRNVVRAQLWQERIIAGEVYCKEQLAQESGLNASHVGRILRLGTLSPHMVESILHHRATQLSAPSGSYQSLPLDWLSRLPTVRAPQLSTDPWRRETAIGF